MTRTVFSRRSRASAVSGRSVAADGDHMPKIALELKVLRADCRSVQGCIERDGSIEHLGDRAGRLGFLGKLEELVARNARDLAARGQRNRCDAPAGTLLLHGEIGSGL